MPEALRRNHSKTNNHQYIYYMRKHLFVTLLLTCGLPFGYSFAAYAEPAPQTQNQNVATITGTIPRRTTNP